MAARGDVQEDIVTLIESDPNQVTAGPSLAAPVTEDCCVILPIFGDTSDTDPFKNDRNSFIRRYDKLVTAVSLVIQKCENGAYVDKHTITDNTYGTFSDFGDFSTSRYKYISIYMDWREVLIAFGEGIYRIKTLETNSLASLGVQNQFSNDFRLLNFTVDRADGTIKLDSTNEGILGDRFNQKETFTFPPNFQDGIRLPGWFGGDNSSYEEEHTRYNNGYLQHLTSTQTEKYILEIDRVPKEVHKFVKTNMLQATTLTVTDYNKNNATEHIRTNIHKPGDYSPVYYKTSKLAKVTVEMESAYDNMRELNC